MKEESKFYLTAVLVFLSIGLIGLCLAIVVKPPFAVMGLVGLLGAMISGFSWSSWSDDEKKRQSESDRFAFENHPETIRKRLERDIALRGVELKHMEEELSGVIAQLSAPNPEEF